MCCCRMVLALKAMSNVYAIVNEISSISCIFVDATAFILSIWVLVRVTRLSKWPEMEEFKIIIVPWLRISPTWSSNASTWLLRQRLCRPFNWSLIPSRALWRDIFEVVEPWAQHYHEAVVSCGRVMHLLYHDFPTFEENFVLRLLEYFSILLVTLSEENWKENMSYFAW